MYIGEVDYRELKDIGLFMKVPWGMKQPVMNK